MRAAGQKISDIYLKYEVNDQAQLSAISYTMRGVRWTPHAETGGTFPYLSEIDAIVFKNFNV